MWPEAPTVPAQAPHPDSYSYHRRGVEDVAQQVIHLYSNGNGRHCTADLDLEVKSIVTRAASAWMSDGRWEAAAALLALIPPSLERVDSEHARLRVMVALYEFRRVARVRRRMLLAIAAVLLYLFAISPT